MEKLELDNLGKNTDTYTYNEIDSEIVDVDDYTNFIGKCYLQNDYSALEKKLDKYIEYIYDLIKQADYLVYAIRRKELEGFEKSLDYKKIDVISANTQKVIHRETDLFDLKTEESKEFLKNNLKFNVGDEDREIIEFNPSRKYVYNNFDENYLGIYRLIKGNSLIADLWQLDGYLYDYRPKEEIEKHKEKYRNMK